MKSLFPVVSLMVLFLIVQACSTVMQGVSQAPGSSTMPVADVNPQKNIVTERMKPNETDIFISMVPAESQLTYQPSELSWIFCLTLFGRVCDNLIEGQIYPFRADETAISLPSQSDRFVEDE
jgi:hypothetical protein